MLDDLAKTLLEDLIHSLVSTNQRERKHQERRINQITETHPHFKSFTTFLAYAFFLMPCLIAGILFFYRERPWIEIGHIFAGLMILSLLIQAGLLYWYKITSRLKFDDVVLGISHRCKLKPGIVTFGPYLILIGMIILYLNGRSF